MVANMVCSAFINVFIKYRALNIVLFPSVVYVPACLTHKFFFICKYLFCYTKVRGDISEN